MNRYAAALLVSLAAGGVHAQDVPSRSDALIAEPAERSGMAPAARLFEIRDGRLWMDGRPLPADAIPQGLDLSGVMLQLELVGAVIPVVEVDGDLYVLERERLVPYESSSRAGRPVYILASAAISPQAAPADRLEPVVDEAYFRQLSDADQALYEKVERERQLESEVSRLARKVRQLPPGPAVDSLQVALRASLATLFDLKQEIRREELTRAESEIRALRAILAERERIRDEVIDLRLQQLMGTEPLDHD